MLFTNTGTEEHGILNKSFEYGCKISSPVIWVTTIFTATTYILNIFLSSTNTENIVNIAEKLIFPLISSGVAVGIGGAKALPSGILAGLIAESGICITSMSNNFLGISGIYGSVLAGTVAGYILKHSEKMLRMYQRSNNPLKTVSTVLSFIIVLFTALIINDISMYINSLCLLALTGIGGVSSVLVSVILGIFMTADCMGPLYLAGYLFSSAALATGDSNLFVSISAASVVPCLSIGVFCLIYSNRFTNKGKISAIASITGGIIGAPVSALPFYTENPIKMSVASASGGCVASMLCNLFRCNTEKLSKGILSLLLQDSPVYFLLSLLSGVLVTVFLMSLLFSTETTEEIKKENTKALSVNTA